MVKERAVEMGRLERALDLVEKVRPLLPGTYRVPGSLHPYVVVFKEGEMSCTCPDYEKRGNLCKHILAVMIWERLKRKEAEKEEVAVL